jgi:ectoine hydroxylase-related dioxygenase (phytanoyl-CoA dioxygenase family)
MTAAEQQLDLAASVALLGFHISPDVFSADEMAELARILSHAPLPHTKAGIRHALRHPAVAGIARDPRLLCLAKEVLGNHVIPFRVTLFDKSLDSNWLVVWHQDTALPIRERRELPGWGPWSVKDDINYAHAPASALEQVLAIRVHLDDSARDNGPLRVLPGTHSQGVLTDDQIHQLASEIEPVECLVARGGLVLMSPLIVHASSKLVSTRSRRVLHIEYSGSEVIDGLELKQT